MGVLESARKHRFEGIGRASALLIFTKLAASPAVAVTQGLLGKVIFFLFTHLFSGLASCGLVLLNLGVANIEILSEKKNFDGSFDEAFKFINERGGRLTREEAKQVDDGVIDAFRRFIDFGVRRDV